MQLIKQLSDCQVEEGLDVFFPKEEVSSSKVNWLYGPKMEKVTGRSPFKEGLKSWDGDKDIPQKHSLVYQKRQRGLCSEGTSNWLIIATWVSFEKLFTVKLRKK